MSTRASFTGTLSFGLVTLPIKAFAISADREIELRFLHTPCRAPIHQKKFCTKCGGEVSTEALSRGIQHGEGYLPLDSQALKSLVPEDETPRVLNVHQTITPGAVDPLWADKAYYIHPAEALAVRPYALITRALRDEKRWAVVTYISHSKSHLGVIRPEKEQLVLQTLLYAEALRTVEDYGIETVPVKVSTKEVNLAKMLVRRMEAPFAHKDFKDAVKANFVALVQATIHHQPTPEVPLPKMPEKIIDLTHALQASLKRVEAKAAGKPMEKKRGAR